MPSTRRSFDVRVFFFVILALFVWGGLYPNLTTPGTHPTPGWLHDLPPEMIDRFQKEAAEYHTLIRVNLNQDMLSKGLISQETTPSLELRSHLLTEDPSNKEAKSILAHSTAGMATGPNEHFGRFTSVSTRGKLPRVLLFIIVRSKDTNTRYRSAARSTWLSSTGLVSPELAQYRFFVDKVGCCAEEAARENDIVVASADWLSANFSGTYGTNMGYKDLAWGGEGFSTQNYARDWDVNLIMWAAKNYDFKYIVPIDDDAFLCGPNLISQLQLLPRTLSSMVMGYTRWDAFDNCFVIMTRDVANFFVHHYYDLLRPTHHPSTHFNFKGAGSSFGGGWTVKVGDWQRVFSEHGFSLVFRSLGVPRSCVSCMEPLITGGDKNSRCHEGRRDYWKDKCTNISTSTLHCILPDCYPEKDHECHAPLVDHRPFNDAWSLATLDPPEHFHEPAHVCSNRFIFDKVKQPSNMITWWNIFHSNKSKSIEFKDRTDMILFPNKRPKLCIHVKPSEPGMVGPDVDPVLNFMHDW